MGVSSQPPLLPAEALCWLVQVSAYARFEAGPPGLVRIVIHDPLDASQVVEVLRLVAEDITAEAAFLDAVTEAKTMVTTAQAGGRFRFFDASDRGWQGDTFRG